MRGIRAMLVVAWLLVACGGQAQPATVDPATPAATTTEPLPCGTELRESLTLTSDMTCDQIALVITADNVVLDLGGHTLSGPGPGRRTWPLPSFDVAGVVVRGDNVTVRNGTIRHTGIAVLAEDAHGATFEALTASESYYGLYLYRGGGHTVRDNRVTENVYGLHLQESHGNRVSGNDLSLQTHHSPGGYGLYLYQSHDNWFDDNLVSSNLNWGLWFSGSTGNTVVRNNVISNRPQVSDDSGGNTYFDPAKREGNYWDDYSGDDANGDGIGDIPYAIGGPGNSTDPYPFVAQDGWRGRTTETVALATPLPASATPPRIYVARADGVIVVIDPRTTDQVATWHLGVASRSLAISPDGTRLYAISGDAAEAAGVLAIDTASGEIVERWEVPGALVVAATYDGERVIVSTTSGLTEIVLKSGEIRQQHDGANAGAVTPSWKHNLVIVTSRKGTVKVVYLPDQHAAYRFELPGRPVQAVDNRSGTRLFVLVEGESDVLIIDTEQFAVTDRVPLAGVDPSAARIAPSPDGSTVYILDTLHARLVAIDLGTKRVIAELTVTGQAVDLTVSADGAFISVAVGEGSNGRVVILDRALQPRGSVDIFGRPAVVTSPR